MWDWCMDVIGINGEGPCFSTAFLKQHCVAYQMPESLRPDSSIMLPGNIAGQTTSSQLPRSALPQP